MKLILLALMLAATATANAAVTISASATTPATDAFDQYSFVTGGTLDTGKDYSDNGGPPGQTFTTPAGSDFELRSISFKGGNSADGSISLSTWAYRISAVSGTTLTPLKTGTGYGGPVSGLTSTSWLTFTFTDTDVLTLSPNTTYAIEFYSETRWWGIARDTAGTAYANGSAFNSTSPGRSFSSTTINLRSWDRTFHVDLEVVPEPSTWMLAGSGLILLFVVRRRRSRSPLKP